MRVFCIRCGGWEIDVNRKLGVPVRYVYTCRNCGSSFCTEEWELYQKENNDELMAKKAELERMKNPGKPYGV